MIIALMLGGLAAMPRATWGGSLGDVFERVAPSVVVVRTTERDVSEVGEKRPVSIAGLGSGVLVSADGNLLTAAHLVQTASEVRVEFVGGQRVGARVVASDPDADVALLQLDSVPPSAVVARLGDSDHARIGDEVLVVGARTGSATHSRSGTSAGAISLGAYGTALCWPSFFRRMLRSTRATPVAPCSTWLAKSSAS